MKKTIIQALLVASLLSSPLFAQTAESIIQRMEENTIHSTARIEGTMIINDRFGEMVTTFISYSRGADDTLIEFTSRDEAGQKILRTADEIYLYYPDAEEIIRLQGAALRDSVLGSDMSYEDLTGGKGLMDSYDITLLGREMIRGRSCYKLELKAKRRNVAYPKQIMWVDDQDFIYLKVEQYALSGRLLKEVYVEETQTIKGKTLPVRTIISDKLKKNSNTMFIVDNIDIDIYIPENTFSLQELTW